MKDKKALKAASVILNAYACGGKVAAELAFAKMRNLEHRTAQIREYVLARIA